MANQFLILISSPEKLFVVTPSHTMEWHTVEVSRLHQWLPGMVPYKYPEVTVNLPLMNTKLLHKENELYHEFCST